MHIGTLANTCHTALQLAIRALEEAEPQLEEGEEEEVDALTILAGEELSDEAFQEIVDAIEEAQPDLEIDAHRGEQPLYPVIFSIE